MEQNPAKETTATPQKIKEYIIRTGTDRVFADHASIIALSETLNRPIVIMEYDTSNNNKPKIRTTIGNDKTGDPIFVHFDEQRKHCSALLVQEKYNSRKILQELKNTTPASSSHAELPSTPPAKRPRSSQ